MTPTRWRRVSEVKRTEVRDGYHVGEVVLAKMYRRHFEKMGLIVKIHSIGGRRVDRVRMDTFDAVAEKLLSGQVCHALLRKKRA